MCMYLFVYILIPNRATTPPEGPTQDPSSPDTRPSTDYTNAEKQTMNGGVDAWLHSFPASLLDGGEWSASRPVHTTRSTH